jgi:GAF domain-containing protein
MGIALENRRGGSSEPVCLQEARRGALLIEAEGRIGGSRIVRPPRLDPGRVGGRTVSLRIVCSSCGKTGAGVVVADAAEDERFSSAADPYVVRGQCRVPSSCVPVILSGTARAALHLYLENATSPRMRSRPKKHQDRWRVMRHTTRQAYVSARNARL